MYIYVCIIFQLISKFQHLLTVNLLSEGTFEQPIRAPCVCMSVMMMRGYFCRYPLGVCRTSVSAILSLKRQLTWPL